MLQTWLCLAGRDLTVCRVPELRELRSYRWSKAQSDPDRQETLEPLLTNSVTLLTMPVDRDKDDPPFTTFGSCLVSSDTTPDPVLIILFSRTLILPVFME
jgi:hypothetical protein